MAVPRAPLVPKANRDQDPLTPGSIRAAQSAVWGPPETTVRPVLRSGEFAMDLVSDCLLGRLTADRQMT